MKCQNCGKNEANFYYTQIINGEKNELALCSDCAMKLGLDDMSMGDPMMNFRSFLGDFFNDYSERGLFKTLGGTALKCKECGTTYDDFINDGIFGCSECYDVFTDPIDSLLKNLHGNTRHIGRGPGKDAKRIVDQTTTESAKGVDGDNLKNGTSGDDRNATGDNNGSSTDGNTSNTRAAVEGNTRSINRKIKHEESEEEKKARLEKELEKAVKDERYEDAAKIRDEIKTLDSKQ